MSACAATPTAYRRREQELGVLYEVMREHLETFLVTYDPPARALTSTSSTPVRRRRRCPSASRWRR